MPFVHSFIHSVCVIHSFIHSVCVIHSFIHAFIHSVCVIHSFGGRPRDAFLWVCRSFCLFHSFIHSFILCFIHFIHSFLCFIHSANSRIFRSEFLTFVHLPSHMFSCSHSEQQRSDWTTATRKPRGGRGCHRRCRRPGGGKPSTKKKIIGRGSKVRRVLTETRVGGSQQGGWLICVEIRQIILRLETGEVKDIKSWKSATDRPTDKSG